MQESRENTKRAVGAAEMRDSFGFREVDQDRKQGLVNDVFDKVAHRYDLMNDLMSLGVHRLWKRAMVARLAPPKNRAWKCLDVAGGTGDIALRIAEASNRQAQVTVLDINASMLAVGRRRAEAAGLSGSVSFVEGNAEALPFPDASFDAYTIAFGIRNVTRIDVALAEARRVLKFGGRFLCLEFSEVDLPLIDKAYAYWSARVIPRLGELIAGDREPYRYLVESIAKFPGQRRFAAMIAHAGFSRCDFANLSGGIVALHSGWKL